MKVEKKQLAFAISLFIILLLSVGLYIIWERDNDLHNQYVSLKEKLSTMGMEVLEEDSITKFYPRQVFYLKVKDKELLIKHYYPGSLTEGEYVIEIIDLSNLSLSEKVLEMSMWWDEYRSLPLGRQHFFINRFLPEIIDKYLSLGVDYFYYSSEIVTKEWKLEDFVSSNKLNEVVAFTTFEGNYSNIRYSEKEDYCKSEMVIRFSSSDSGFYSDIYCDPVVEHELKSFRYSGSTGFSVS